MDDNYWDSVMRILERSKNKYMDDQSDQNRKKLQSIIGNCAVLIATTSMDSIPLEKFRDFMFSFKEEYKKKSM